MRRLCTITIYLLLLAVWISTFVAWLHSYQPPIKPPNLAKQAEQPDPLPAALKRHVSARFQTGVSLPPFSQAALNAYEQQSGTRPAVLEWYQPWGGPINTQFPLKWVRQVEAQRIEPLITWESWTPEVYPLNTYEPAWSLATILSGKYDAYVRQWAQASKDYEKPFFLRLDPEMNGDWNPWYEGTNGNKLGQFVKMWRHVHNIFTAIGAKNVIWDWTPNIDDNGETEMYLDYPGNKYVDWIGLDGFNWGETPYGGSVWRTFNTTFSISYKELIETAPTKPIMIAETGSAEGSGDDAAKDSKAAWIVDMYGIQLPEHYTKVKIVIWFDEISQRDWRIASSPSALEAYQDAMRLPWIKPGNDAQ